MVTPSRRPCPPAEGACRRVWIACMLTALLAAATACQDDGDPGNGDPGNGAAVDTSRGVVEAGELDASVTQHRYDEGTQDLLAGITNNSDRAVRISSARIQWRGLDFPTVTVEDPLIAPGETAAFTARYADPRCGIPQPGTPTMVAVVDGRTMTLPLRVDLPGLLPRIRGKACDLRALASLASVDLRLAGRTRVVDGTEVLPGRVVVTRRRDRPGTVTVDDLGGSVLFAVEAAGGRGALPARLDTGQRRRTLPVLVRSTGRCDAHSRSQSSQTFLFSVFVHRDSAPVLRLIRIPQDTEQERLLRMLDRVCG